MQYIKPRLQHTLCLLLIILSTKCTRPLDLPLNEEIENQIAFSSFFTSNDLKVNINALRSVLETESRPIETAQLELHQNDTLVSLLTNEGQGWYAYTGSQLNYGSEYSLIVSYEDKEIITKDKLPQQRIVPHSAAYIFIQKENGEEYIDIQFSFQDTPDTNNFYEFLILTTFYNDQKDSTQLSYMNEITVPDAVLSREGDIPFNPSSYVFSDAIIDGQDYEMNLRFENSSQVSKQIEGKYRNNEAERYLVFRSVSEHYYKFRKSWFKHHANLATDAQFDTGIQILFSGEPSSLYSNASEGIGIFASYHEIIIPIQEL